MNLPPEIIRPIGAAVTEIPLQVRSETAKAVVIAADPEGEPLQFVWVTPGEVIDVSTYPQGDDVWVSTLTVHRDTLAEGDLLRVTVFDDNPRLNAVDVVWRVELP